VLEGVVAALRRLDSTDGGGRAQDYGFSMLTPKVICLAALPSAHGSPSPVPGGQRRVERREALISAATSPTAALTRSPAAKLAAWTARSWGGDGDGHE